jgi:hypothetical protein
MYLKRFTMKNILIWAMQPEAPYTAMTRGYLEEKTPKLALPAHPHAHIDFPDGAEGLKRLVETNRMYLRLLE